MVIVFEVSVSELLQVFVVLVSLRPLIPSVMSTPAICLMLAMCVARVLSTNCRGPSILVIRFSNSNGLLARDGLSSKMVMPVFFFRMRMSKAAGSG